MIFFKRLRVIFALSAFVGLPSVANASNWPDSIFDGAAPAVLGVVKSHPDLVADAEQHIYYCVSPAEKALCQFNQYHFILDYVAAFYNDHNSQLNVAYDFSEQGAGFGDTVSYSAPEPGILANPIQSCSWALAILRSGGSGVEPNDFNEADVDCKDLSDDATAAAKARAATIDQEISRYLSKGDDPSAVVDAD